MTEKPKTPHLFADVLARVHAVCGAIATEDGWPAGIDLSRVVVEPPRDLRPEWLPPEGAENNTQRIRRIGNFIAGMTDRFALAEHGRLFDTTPELR